jgi:hypothetical protein
VKFKSCPRPAVHSATLEQRSLAKGDTGLARWAIVDGSLAAAR